jgi:hypothetical protein
MKRPTVTVDVVFLSAAEGGRQLPPGVNQRGLYRPHLVIQDRTVRRATLDEKGGANEEYLGVVFPRGPRSSPLRRTRAMLAGTRLLSHGSLRWRRKRRDVYGEGGCSGGWPRRRTRTCRPARRCDSKSRLTGRCNGRSPPSLRSVVRSPLNGSIVDMERPARPI